MKIKITLALLPFLFFSSITDAQIKKGSILLGGGISYSSTTMDNSTNPKINNTIVIFSAGKAISVNSVLGINLSYNHSLTSNIYDSSSNRTKGNTYTAGIFYRKYKTLGKKFYLFGQVATNFSYTKYSYNFPTYTGNPAEIYGADLSLTPGLAYQLLSKFQLEVTLPSLAGFSYETVKGVNTRQKIFNAYANLPSFSLNNLIFGFRVIL